MDSGEKFITEKKKNKESNELITLTKGDEENEEDKESNKSNKLFEVFKETKKFLGFRKRNSSSLRGRTVSNDN